MGRKITNLETAIRNVFADLEDNGFSTGTPDTIEYNCCQTCSWSSFEDKDKEKMNKMSEKKLIMVLGKLWSRVKLKLPT